MKTLIIYPPQWNPSNPYLSVPLLCAELRKACFECRVLDANILFYNKILSTAFLREEYSRAKRLYAELSKEIFAKYPDPEKAFPTLSVQEQTKLLRLKRLNAFIAGNETELERTDCSCGNASRFGKGRRLTPDEIINSVDSAVAVLRSKTDFYDPEKLFDAKMILAEALKIASLRYAPCEIIWDNYFSNPLLSLSWENIDAQCRDMEANMFYGFFEELIEQYKVNDYGLVCISVPDLSQLIPAFTLARLIKEKTACRVAVGGNYITQNKKEIASHPEIFGEYADFIMTGDGDRSVPALAAFVSGIGEIKDIGGLLYKAGCEIISNSEAEKLNTSEMAVPDFSDYDFSLYFTPEIVLPYGMSKGCYWGKCAFCDYFYGQQCFDIKSVEKVVSELEDYKNKYGISRFIITDEAVPPVYYEKLADEIIKRKLEIYYYSFARLEKGFTPEVLQKMYKSGCRILMWGYESESERLLKMMNKGVDASIRLDIMRNAHNAGIWNNALFIIGFPTETLEETNRTLDVIKNNRDIINSCTPSNYALKKNSVMAKHIGENGVLGYKEIGEFYTVYADETQGISRLERREIRRKFHLDFITENSRCLWPVVYSDFDSTLLYMAKYGLDFVAGYRSDRNICPMFR